MGVVLTHLAVDGVSESVHDTSKESLANGDVDDGSGTLDGVAFLDETIVTEHHNTDVVGFQVQRHALRKTTKSSVNSMSPMKNRLLERTLRPDENSTISSAWQFFNP